MNNFSVLKYFILCILILSNAFLFIQTKNIIYFLMFTYIDVSTNLVETYGCFDFNLLAPEFYI
jgi:hypothetical protein